MENNSGNSIQIFEETASEGTKIEQARAFSEVLMQAKLAKEFPRDMKKVFRKLEETFQSSKALLDACKYSYERGNKPITDYTIKFARAVAGCVGNIHFSIKELSRSHTQSEMHVYAWDVESNTMQTRTVIVKHEQYAASEPKKLGKERDIYENNTNVAARRLRECLMAVLPGPAVDKAKDIVEDLLIQAYPPEKRKQLAQTWLNFYEKEFNISNDRVILACGDTPPEMWIKEKFAWLSMASKLLKQGSAKADDLFPEADTPGADQIQKELGGSEKSKY